MDQAAAATYVETRTVPLDELTPYPGNAKLHDLPTIAASLARNGQYRPLVVREIEHGPLIVLAGNGTLQAMVEHGPGKCPAQQTYEAADDKTRESLRPCALCHDSTWNATARCEIHHCDDATARRINLVDNRAGELAGYDNDALAAPFTDLDTPDLDGTGYTQADIDLLTASPPSLDALADEYGEPADDDLWPTLKFRVPPQVRDRFYALTDGCDPDDDDTRFRHLITMAAGDA